MRKENKMFLWFLVIVAILLVVVAIIVLLLTEYKIQLPLSRGEVYINLWTGKPRCALWGTTFLVPGIHKPLEKELSFLNDPDDPPATPVVTADGIDIEFDWVYRHLQVGYPGMPELTSDDLDTELLKQCGVKVVTAIKYSDRKKNAYGRVLALSKRVFGKYKYNQLFKDSDLSKDKPGEKDKDLLEEIAAEINEFLRVDEVAKSWGLWVEIDPEDINLPAKARKTREENATADMAGEAVDRKAKKAGVHPAIVMLADAISNLFGKGDK